MDANAFHNNCQSQGFRASQGQNRLLHTLKQYGYVNQRDGGNSWFFTQAGIAATTRLSIVSAPRLVFEGRRDLPLENLTTYELVMKLKDDAWTWQLWVPPSGRRRPSGGKQGVDLFGPGPRSCLSQDRTMFSGARFATGLADFGRTNL